MQIKQVYFVLSKQEETYFLAFPAFCFKSSKQAVYACQRERVELWVTDNLFNVFVMHALGSAHEKFDV